jgi:hypothetical protein
MMSKTHEEQAGYLSVINDISELPEINKQIFRCHSAIMRIKSEFASIFDEIDLFEERISRLKERAQVLFKIEQVKSYPDPDYCGTLTLVSGRRYIPIKKAQEMLDKRTFASLVTQGKGYVKWTPPKEDDNNE